VKYIIILFFILIQSCSNREVINKDIVATDSELMEELISLVEDVDERKIVLDQKKIEDSGNDEITELEDELLLRNIQLIKFIDKVFSKRKSFLFSSKEIVRLTALKIIFSKEKKLCSISWDTGLGGTMNQNVLICQFLQSNNSISSKILYAPGIKNGKLKYNCIARSITKIPNKNVYLLIGSNKFGTNENGQCAFFLTFNSGRLRECNTLKYHGKVSNYFILRRNFNNESYTIEIEDEILTEKMNLGDISSVQIKTLLDRENRINILIIADNVSDLIWRNDHIIKFNDEFFLVFNN